MVKNQLGLIVIVAGWLVAGALCTIRWEKGVVWRYLPILYGFLIGAIVLALRKAETWIGRVEPLFVCVGLGLLFWFAIWVDAIRKRKA